MIVEIREKRTRRTQPRKGYWVVRDPHGRYAKVKKEDIGFIPKNWRIVKKKEFYNLDGSLTEIAVGVITITSKKHAEWFTSPANLNLGIRFGYG